LPTTVSSLDSRATATSCRARSIHLSFSDQSANSPIKARPRYYPLRRHEQQRLHPPWPGAGADGPLARHQRATQRDHRRSRAAQRLRPRAARRRLATCVASSTPAPTWSPLAVARACAARRAPVSWPAGATRSCPWRCGTSTLTSTGRPAIHRPDRPSLAAFEAVTSAAGAPNLARLRSLADVRAGEATKARF
jgi:hypothetical protein